MAETATRSPAAPADAEETFELSPDDLKDAAPEGDEVDLEDAETPEVEAAEPKAEDTKPEPKAEVKPEPEPEPKPTPKVQPKAEEPEREEPRERLHPAVHAERAKRKEYARLFAETKEQLDEAERTIRLLRAEADSEADPSLKKWKDDLLTRASQATDLAEVVKITMEEMDRRDRARVRQLNPIIYQAACDASEAKARAAYPDWEAVIKKAGLFEAIQTDSNGQFKDPRVANRIYYNADKSLNADPATRMYKLALGKLEYEREQRGEPEPEEREVKPVQNGNGAGKQAEPRAEVVEAARRARQEVVEEVSKTSSRLKSIRSIPKAAAPSRITRADLDVMLEKDPQKYQRLISRQPALERWHLGG